MSEVYPTEVTENNKASKIISNPKKWKRNVAKDLR